MTEQPKKNFLGFGRVKKYFPFVVLTILTISLMFFFKHKKEEIGKILEEGKNNILAFYAENLKPLLFRTTISDEDVFNFALYNTLPLDKNRNKILEISADQSGGNTFVIKTTGYNPNTKNYATFVKYMGMNEVQKGKADSILNSYKKEIYSSVLVNEKNTYAVNPKLGEIQQAVLADLLTFAQTVDRSKSKDLFADYSDNADKNEFANLIVSAKKIPQNEYLLITPDTVARSYFKWDQQKFNQHLSDLEKSKFNIAPPPLPNLDMQFEGTHSKLKDNETSPPSDFSFNIDSNFLKVVIPVETMNLSKVIQDSVRIKLNEAARKMKRISISYGHTKYNSRIPGKSKAAGEPEIIINPFEIVNKTMEMLSKSGVQDWEKFGNQMDSLSRMYKPYMKDSLKKKIQEEMQNATKDFRRIKSRSKVDSVTTRQK
jgi:hypothetical protein